MNFKSWLVVGPAWLAVGSMLGAEGPAVGTHPFRLSVADVTVSGTAMEVRIRFFWDDLQLAVIERESDMEFRLAETPRADSVVGRYIDAMLVFETRGEALAGVLAERGIEDAPRADEVMWWYLIRYELPPGTERIGIRNRVLFNVFEDQRNLVHLKTRSGRERAYYFTWDDDQIEVPIR